MTAPLTCKRHTFRDPSSVQFALAMEEVEETMTKRCGDECTIISQGPLFVGFIGGRAHKSCGMRHAAHNRPQGSSRVSMP